ncbi:MAG TPA: leucyl/phenylalanyl-tRNA--protein transferase, partial [Marmoricola sp.]|nr:leucyl/phenylalanyl-tRNA--protein transferase [Marmoricola sp.]
HSLARLVRRHPFELRTDTAFEAVTAHCARDRNPENRSWISPEIRAVYARLHTMGHAHSVEAWRDGQLVGGLYGVAIGGLFAGESMFHRGRDASKVALAGLVAALSDEYAEQRLIDVQWQTDHLASLGVIQMPRTEYLARLPKLLALPLPLALSRRQ